MLCYDDSVIDFYAMPVSKGRENNGVSGMKVSGTSIFPQAAGSGAACMEEGRGIRCLGL